MDPYATIKKYIYIDYVLHYIVPIQMIPCWCQLDDLKNGSGNYKQKAGLRNQLILNAQLSTLSEFSRLFTILIFDPPGKCRTDTSLKNLNCRVSKRRCHFLERIKWSNCIYFLLLLMPFKGFKHHEIFFGEVQQIKNYWIIKI